MLSLISPFLAFSISKFGSSLAIFAISKRRCHTCGRQLYFVRHGLPYKQLHVEESFVLSSSAKRDSLASSSTLAFMVCSNLRELRLFRHIILLRILLNNAGNSSSATREAWGRSVRLSIFDTNCGGELPIAPGHNAASSSSARVFELMSRNLRLLRGDMDDTRPVLMLQDSKLRERRVSPSFGLRNASQGNGTGLQLRSSSTSFGVKSRREAGSGAVMLLAESRSALRKLGRESSLDTSSVKRPQPGEENTTRLSRRLSGRDDDEMSQFKISNVSTPGGGVSTAVVELSSERVRVWTVGA